MNDNTKIAGKKTVGEWKILRLVLLNSPNNNENWGNAFEDFLLKRITTRYLDPIEAITKISAQEGKGFSIIAIYCSLIEFFETLKKGYGFDNRHYVDQLGNLIRSVVNLPANGIGNPLSTKEVFVNFLTENAPFNNFFTVPLAESFYYNVRCSILHQAETKENWYIKDGADGDNIIEVSAGNPQEKILRWKPLKAAFNDYLNNTYRMALLGNNNLKTNFIFKWDNICA